MPNIPAPASSITQGIPAELTPAGSPTPIYFNTVAVALVSSGDVVMALSLNGNPIQTQHTTISVAKTLRDALTRAVNNYEHATGGKVMSVEELTEAMNSAIPLAR